MATQSMPLVGPWGGIEERESAQTDKHCEVAINIDFSRGYIEGRDGFEILSTFNGPTRAQVGVFDRPSGDPYVLLVGPSDYRPERDSYVTQVESPDIYCTICTLDGVVISTTDLTTVFGEPADPHFRCSFVPTVTNNNTFGGLITTKYQSYMFDPAEDDTKLRLTRMSLTPEVLAGTVPQDPELAYQDMTRYWGSRPKGSIAIEHGARVFYAGFIHGDEVLLDGILPADQTLVSEKKILGTERNRIGIGANEVYFSDSFDDLGIPAYHAFSCPGNERITGLSSLGSAGKLLILTNESIYMRASQNDASALETSWHRVVAGRGCVSPHAIETIGTAVIFIGNDGIYAFDGQQIQKLSKPIDSLWTGEHHKGRLPPAMATIAEQLGYPFSIATDRLRLATSVHVRSKNQIWFFVPVKTKTSNIKNQMPLCIVFDYVNKAFSFFCSRTGRTLLWDATSYISGGKEHIIGAGPAAHTAVPLSIAATGVAATLSSATADPTAVITVIAASGSGSLATTVDGTTITTPAEATPMAMAREHADDLESDATVGSKVSVWVTDNAKIHIAARSVQKTTLVRYGGSNTDPDGKGIPVIWMSARHFKQNEESISFRNARYRMMAWGKNPTDNSVQWFMEGEQAAFDSQVEGSFNTDRQETSGDLDTHPSQSNNYFYGAGHFPVVFTTSTAGGSGGVVTFTNTDTPLALDGGATPTRATITIATNGTGESTTVTAGGVSVVVVHGADVEETATRIYNACRADAPFDAIMTADLDGRTVGFTVKTAKATYWAANDWFTSRIDPGPVSSKWCQLGFVDDANTSGREPAVSIQEYSIEVPQTSKGLR